VQLVSDLVADGLMHFSIYDATTVGVRIDVTNVGNAPAVGTGGHVVVINSIWGAKLYQYAGGTANPAANTLNPGEHGYILTFLPNGMLKPCHSYPVNIDFDRSMQAGPIDPFANDQSTSATQCLSWTSPIDVPNLIDASSRVVTKKTSQMKTLPPVNLSIS